MKKVVMKKDTFAILLEDLYNVYKPEAKEHIPELVDKYNRLEFDSVKSIFIKYNHKRQPFYDESVGTDVHVLQLIKDYAEGRRTFQNYVLKNAGDQRREETIQQTQDKIQEVKSELSTELGKKIEGIELFLNSKEKQIDEKYKELMNSVLQKSDEYEVKVLLKDTDEEMDISNKKELKGFGIGARVITKRPDGSIMGVEIVDIFCDLVSYDKPVIEIQVNKL